VRVHDLAPGRHELDVGELRLPERAAEVHRERARGHLDLRGLPLVVPLVVLLAALSAATGLRVTERKGRSVG
jgi:hypothetical protein